MYENYYGLTEKPFSLLPDPEYLYLSRHHHKALTLLEYGILNQAGFCVISGQAGAGKTTLIRHLLNRFDEDTTIGLLSNTHDSFEELLAWILMSFDLPYQGKSKTELYQSFVDFLIEQYANKRHTVLIIDEAQNMSPSALEELRMLSNINADKDQLLQMILMGQPGLLKNLQRPELRQFAQRIAVDYKLDAMTEVETCAYVHYRLKVAGAQSNIFDNSACLAVYHHSRGLPRLINLLCDTALVYGFAESLKVIDKRIVDDVVKERDENTILPHYHELNEEVSAAEITPELETQIADEGRHVESLVQENAAPLSEAVANNEHASLSAVAASAASHVQTVSSSDIVAPRPKASVTSLKQAEHFSKAMDLKKTLESSEPNKNTTLKNAKGNEVVVDITPVEPKYSGNSMVNEPEISERSSQPPTLASNRGSGKLSFIILGLAFGVLISAAILILYKMDNLTAPALSESEIAGRMSKIENEFARKLQAIEHQREIDLNKTRLAAQEKEVSQAQAAAHKREKEATLAIAKAREELIQAKMAAERAKQSERLAKEKASLALERARAVELEAKLREQQEREARLREQQEAALAAAKYRREAKSRSIARQQSMSFDDTVDPFPAEDSELEAVEEIPVSALTKKPVKSDKDSGFSSDPCKGPTAVLLSTCKK